jgi:hypothetical protein
MCESGGTGIRSGFRSQRPKGIEGSTPSFRTNTVSVMESADIGDLKSPEGNLVGVRPPSFTPDRRVDQRLDHRPLTPTLEGSSPSSSAMHGNVLLILDQRTGIDKQLWEAGEALLKSGNSRWLALSSPMED